MSKTLEQLFDFQKFEGNRDLQKVIDSVHAKYAVRELDFSDMEMVNAAGEFVRPDKQKDEEK